MNLKKKFWTVLYIFYIINIEQFSDSDGQRNMKINVKCAKIRSSFIELTKCHAWLSIFVLRVCKNCNNNLLFNNNKMLSSKQNTCENIETLSESAIAIF